MPSSILPERGAVWENWSGSQQCRPVARFLPGSEEELQEIIRSSRGEIRVAGAGHSFSALVPTGETLICLDRLAGLLEADRSSLRATCWGGTSIHALGKPLAERGMALLNQGDVDAQTLGGAFSTGTHGTGRELGCLATCLEAFHLVTASGEVLCCSPQENVEIFQGGRVSLGGLGIFSRVTLCCREAYGLEERIVTLPLEECLSRAGELGAATRHFEFFHFPYAERALVKTLREIPYAESVAAATDAEEDRLFNFLCRVLHRLPTINPLAQKLAMRWYRRSPRSGPSYQVFPSARTARFHEMEYAVPAEAGPDCFREVIAAIRKARAEVFFPVEFRYVRGDDIWLSPFYERDSAAISVHQYFRRSYKDLFELVEPIFWKYEGRPHWGKLHMLGGAELSQLYPRWEDFRGLRRRLDPEGRFLNEHLRKVLGG